jgi:hypothetical protein
MPLPVQVTPDRWLAQLFASGPAAKGGVVRRAARDVDRIVGRDRFLAELDRRGYRAVENAGTIIVFCNRDPVCLLR